MKRIIAFVLTALTIAVVIAGCVSGGKNNRTDGTTTTEPAATTTAPGTTTSGEKQTTTAPGTTEEPEKPVEKPTASRELAEFLKKTIAENKGGSLLGTANRFLLNYRLDNVEADVSIVGYPENKKPYMPGFVYGTEFPEFVSAASMNTLTDESFICDVFELKSAADTESFCDFLKKNNSYSEGEAEGKEIEIGNEDNFAFIIICNGDLGSDADPDAEDDAVKMMKKLRLKAGLSMSVSRQDTSSDRASYYFGISDAASLVERDGAVCEPMIGGGFSLVMVKVKDKKDAKTVAAEMESGLNLGKWICMHASSKATSYGGEYVVGIMGSGEECERIIAAFNSLFE